MVPMCPTEANISKAGQAYLLSIAKRSLMATIVPEQAARPPEITGLSEAELIEFQRPRACFVTLTKQGELRGCIGTLVATESLLDNVKSYALSAALDDWRFSPVTADELPELTIEISVLTPPQPMTVVDEADLLQQLRPEIDGLSLEGEGHRSTFLPQVWEKLPDRQEFVGQLKRKAGLPVDYWSSALQWSRYQVACFQSAWNAIR